MRRHPIDYEVIEPLKKVRFRLQENDIQPISWDVELTAVLPPFLEAKDEQRENLGFRVQSDVSRFHQLCTAEGTLTIDGETIDITPDEWFAYRDRSWGVRMDVGADAPDINKIQRLDSDFLLLWSPMYLVNPDGSHYEIHYYLQMEGEEVTYFSGFVNNADGSQTQLYALQDSLRFDPVNRRLIGGSLTFDAGWGRCRTLEIEPAGDTGFHLGTGLYFGFKGMRHGGYLGKYHEDGERYEDVSDAKTVREVHQLRDCIIKVKEGDAEGYGILESMVIGEHPRYGLTRETSFL